MFLILSYSSKAWTEIVSIQRTHARARGCMTGCRADKAPVRCSPMTERGREGGEERRESPVLWRDCLSHFGAEARLIVTPVFCPG